MKLSLKNILTSLGVLFFFSGCAITTRVPANRFDSPEVSGKRWAGDMVGGFEGGNQYVITQDDTQIPPNFNSQGFERSDIDPILGGDLGIFDRLDLGVKIRFNSTTMGQVKFQILGEPRLTAKEGNFSLAVTAAAGGASRSDTDNSTVFSQVTANYTVSETDYDFGLIMGYRATDSLLFYGGPSWTHRNYSGSITQTGSGTTPGPFPFNGILEQTGLNIGLQAGAEHFIARLEYAGAFTSGSGQSQYGGYFGAELGFLW